jgi:hypothetical protein
MEIREEKAPFKLHEPQVYIAMPVEKIKLSAFVTALDKATSFQMCDTNISVSNTKIKSVLVRRIGVSDILTITAKDGTEYSFVMGMMDPEVTVYNDGSYKIVNAELEWKPSMTFKLFFDEDTPTDNPEVINEYKSEPKITPEELKKNLL